MVRSGRRGGAFSDAAKAGLSAKANAPINARNAHTLVRPNRVAVGDLGGASCPFSVSSFQVRLHPLPTDWQTAASSNRVTGGVTHHYAHIRMHASVARRDPDGSDRGRPWITWMCGMRDSHRHSVSP